MVRGKREAQARVDMHPKVNSKPDLLSIQSQVDAQRLARCLPINATSSSRALADYGGALAVVRAKREAQARADMHPKVTSKPDILSIQSQVDAQRLAGCLPRNATSSSRALAEYGAILGMVRGKREAQARADMHPKVNSKHDILSIQSQVDAQRLA